MDGVRGRGSVDRDGGFADLDSVPVLEEMGEGDPGPGEAEAAVGEGVQQPPGAAGHKGGAGMMNMEIYI